jgi:hypothetical protein
MTYPLSMTKKQFRKLRPRQIVWDRDSRPWEVLATGRGPLRHRLAILKPYGWKPLTYNEASTLTVNSGSYPQFTVKPPRWR